MCGCANVWVCKRTGGRACLHESIPATPRACVHQCGVKEPRRQRDKEARRQGGKEFRFYPA